MSKNLEKMVTEIWGTGSRKNTQDFDFDEQVGGEGDLF